MEPSACRGPAIWPQFSLLALFEYTTLCCLLAGLSGIVGIGPSICLMLMGLALAAHQGALALVMIWVATVVAAYPEGIDGSNIAAQAMTIVVAFCVCGWYRWQAQRNGDRNRAASQSLTGS
jgi:hypothetical protein